VAALAILAELSGALLQRAVTPAPLRRRRVRAQLDDPSDIALVVTRAAAP
jgi:hypothetical protein